MLNFLRSFWRIKRPSTMEPLIAVVGATGTGKSKLAVDLATRFNGEIINGDAMQMYRGLPIITNQIPFEERNGIPHHLISCVDFEEEPWRIGHFKRECLRLIKDIHSRGKLPILVGGTHYYTQTVLFKDQLVEESLFSGDDDDAHFHKETKPTSAKWPILDAPPDVVFQKLKEVDPVIASRWHPNDVRKIRRSLEIYFQTGKPASEIYAEQKRQKYATGTNGESSPGIGQLRYPTLIFWVHSEKETLNCRLAKRVDSMVEQGLMAEAQRMWAYIREKKGQGITVDQTRGVWVSIGFKELAPYFDALENGELSEGELEALKQSSIELVKIATRQYATSQIKWIRNKLWKALADAGATKNLYLLDSTNVEDWQRWVTEPSEHLTQALLNDEPRPDPKSLSDMARETLCAREVQAQTQRSDVLQTFTCEICSRTMATQDQWNIHLNGRAHKRAIKNAAKRAEREKYLRNQQTLGVGQNCDNPTPTEQPSTPQ
ncbi:tRNA dimethylallyltransferase, mitochondrial [Aspergillus fumigatus]|uniref:tRNA dimethylallyltransferase n=3 Tax=Aspergillus fumigatus TaxID=746128 RepID=Q4WDK6_ASPFU|nr:tRNA isopentenyltransferase, putative [Aspergillus fumigatus Af293]EAL85532.1 tRNA isopentenyltransferase, putative [Aspergillus fumigatus Af293]EDP47477.1 tRNA isopentenyltransferase, putative [Aspergillus fumigatus A1163]